MCHRVTHLIKKSVVQAPSVLETAEIFVKTAKRPFWKANGHLSCNRVPCAVDTFLWKEDPFWVLILKDKPICIGLYLFIALWYKLPSVESTDPDESFNADDDRELRTMMIAGSGSRPAHRETTKHSFMSPTPSTGARSRPLYKLFGHSIAQTGIVCDPPGS
jgi:hypothetical protein